MDLKQIKLKLKLNGGFMNLVRTLILFFFAFLERRITLIGPIRKCPTNSDLLLECTRKVIADLTPLISSKIKEFGLHPLDPVSIDKFVYSLTFGPVNILVQNKNAVITGVSNYDSFSVGIDPKNMKAKFVYEVPYLQLETEYKLSGNAFFFPLTGAGPAHLELCKYLACNNNRNG